MCGLQSKAIQWQLLTEEKLTQVRYSTAHGMKEAQCQAPKLQTSVNVTADWNLQYVERGWTPLDAEPVKHFFLVQSKFTRFGMVSGYEIVIIHSMPY